MGRPWGRLSAALGHGGARSLQDGGATSGAALPEMEFPKKRKRSRWNQDSLEQKTVIPGMPTVIPPGLTREQERAYIGNAAGAILGRRVTWRRSQQDFGVKSSKFGAVPLQ
uniref:Splicing factor 1 n=1 Tax=Phasianus colchicus TaxID=9054 RepID=A0A669QG16_PHACC